METEKYVKIKKDLLIKLIESYDTASSYCSELNIYEYSEMDKDLTKMNKWVQKNFSDKAIKKLEEL